MRTARSIALLLAILSAGCGGGPATPLLDELEGDATLSEAGPRWPPPPAPAHISYLGSIATERAFEPRASLWRRVAQAFAGTEGLHLVRPSALCVRGPVLAVPDPGDIEPLVSYWGAGGRADKVRPLLASVSNSGGATPPSTAGRHSWPR